MAKSKASVKVADFSNVKERGNFNPKHVAEGDYAAKIVKVEDAEAKKTGDFQYIFTFKLQKFSQNSYPYYCKLTENQLWKLRNLAVAAGLNVPKKRMKFDPNKVVGKSVGVTMEDDEYEGKMKSVISAVFPISELADGGEDVPDDDDGFDEDSAVAAVDDDDADEAPAKSKKSKDKGGKKKSKKKGSKEDLEELDINDV
jgi:hypothetical protein